jgi:hypothetical protein
LEAGESPTNTLARKVVRDHVDAGQERLDAEKQSRTPSDEVADIILTFAK